MVEVDQGAFGRLPFEIVQTILDYILRPTDLKALCLVSKHLSELAYRRLYREIIIPESVDDPSWNRLRILSQSTHLHEIQTLQLGKWPTHHDQPRYCENLNNLIPKLRPHSLRSFTYETNCRPRADYLVLLWKMQRRLRKLYFDFKLCAPAINEIATAHRADLQKLQEVEELEIDFAKEGDKEASMLFECLELKNLRKITLESVVPRTYRTNSPIFGSSSLRKQLPPGLTHICFRQLSLANPETWQLNEFEYLESLTLSDCHNVDPALGSLRSKRLKHLHIIDTDAHPVTLISLLSSFDSLQTLSLLQTGSTDFPNADERLVEAIGCHHLQLRVLRFAPLVRGLASSTLELLLLQCPKLETLILGLGLWRLTKDAKSIYEAVPEFDPTYISFMYRPKNFSDDFLKLEQAWTKVAQSNADMIFAYDTAPSSLKFLGFEFRDRILYGGAHFYASELSRHSCFTRPEHAKFFGVPDLTGEGDSTVSGPSYATQVDPKMVPYLMPELYII